MAALTSAQKSNFLGYPKPAELIEITGTHQLDAPDRAIQNKLFQYAHDSGRLTEPDAEWELSLAELRRELSKHESNDAVRASLSKLMKVTVLVHFHSKNGDAKTLETHLLDFIETHNNNGPLATVQYGLPKKLRAVLAHSNRWGRVKCEVTYAMTSKYSIALYELICLRANLKRCVEVFPIDRFRELLGVPPDTYKLGKDFRRFVIEPAVLEINGLSDIGVQVELRRPHIRAPIRDAAVAWWKKQGDEFRSCIEERNRSKLGRMARLRGQVETAIPE